MSLSIDAFLSQIGRMKIYDLEHVRFSGMPAFSLAKPTYYYSLHRHHESQYLPKEHGPRSAASGHLFTSDHSGTHIDAICHQSRDLKLYGGISVGPDVETPWGFTKLGAESIPPIVKMGILLDVAAAKGTDVLPEKYAISVADLEQCCKKENVAVGKDQVLLVRTGSARYWHDEGRYTNSAGASKEASIWLGDKGVFAVGSDNLAWDIVGWRDPETRSDLFAHLHLLAGKGIFIIENLNLEQLSRDECYSFIFLALPLKMKGATGTPIRPMALVPG